MPVHKWALMQSPFPVISKPLCYLSMYSYITFYQINYLGSVLHNKVNKK